jgi:hypothetical protein
MPDDYGLPLKTKHPAVDELADALHARLEKARKTLQAAQQRQAYHANKHRGPAHFAVGQQVLLNSKNISFRAPNAKGRGKFMPRFIGPFPILSIVGESAARLQHLRMHNVFHVSLLRHYKQSSTAPPPPVIPAEEGEPLWFVEEIHAHRASGTGRRHVVEYSVRWQNHGPEYDSWETAQDCRRGCPQAVEAYHTKLYAKGVPLP